MFLCESFQNPINISVNKRIVVVYLIHAVLTLSIIVPLNFHEVFFGWDGVDHYTMARQYAEEISPKLFGWLGNSFAGYVWPLSYAPMYTYILSIPIRIFGSDALVFNLFNTVLFLIQPWILYFTSRKVGISAKYADIGVIAFMFYQISFLPSSAWNGAFLGVYYVGLYPHLLAQVFFLLWLGFFFNPHKTNITYIGSAILTCVIFLSNAHVGILVYLMYLVSILFYCKDRNLCAIQRTLSLVVFSLGLSAFWLVPSLHASLYLPQQTLSCQIFLDFLILVFLASLYFIQKRKRVIKEVNFIRMTDIALISAVIPLFISLFPLNLFYDSLPLHGFRILSGEVPLLVFLVAPVFISSLKGGLYQPSKVLSIFVLLTVTYYMVGGIIGKPVFYEKTSLADLAWYQSAPKHRVLLEHDSPQSQPKSAKLPLTGSETLWNLYKNSSPNSLSITYLRNLFSYEPESVGVVCEDDCDKNYYRIISEPKIFNDQLSLFSVDVVGALSEEAKRLFGNLGYSEITSDSGATYYKINNDYVARDVGLTLYFSDLFPKKSSSYDWSHWGLLWYKYGYFSRYFTRPRDVNLDSTEDFSKFDSAVIATYKYRNLQKAIDNIEKFSSTGTVVFMLDAGPVDALVEHFLKLSEVGLDTVHFVKKQHSAIATYAEVYNILELTTSKNYLSRQADPEQRVYIDRYLAYGKAVRCLSSDKDSYLLLKYSYSPFLTAEENQSLYMVSPAFILLEKEDCSSSDIYLRVDLMSYGKIGFVISASSAIVLVISVVYKRFLTQNG